MLALSVPLQGQLHPAQRVRVSEQYSQALIVKTVQPEYPTEARKKHVEGKVVMQAEISKEGVVESLKVISGDAILTQAATDAVKQWKYKPYLLGGREPFAIQTQVTVTFTLKEK
jgi:protein TonB